MSDWREDLLTVILDCGYGDLYLLENCQYDMEEIIEECIATFGNIKINNLVRIMFDFGLRDIETARDDRICEIEAIQNERELDEEEREDLEALKQLEPFEDICSFHNYIDTHIWIDNDSKRPVYEKHLSDALKRFTDMTGFTIGNLGDGWGE